MSKYDKLWVVSDGKATQRIMAETPEQAFERAKEFVDIDQAQAHEVEYEGGAETIRNVGYLWRDGGLVPLLSDQASWSDPRWADRQAETRDFVAPITPGKAVFLVGYGLSRAMTNHFSRRFPNADKWSLNSDRIPGATTHFQIHKQDVCVNMPGREFELRDLESKGVRIITAANFPYDKVRRDFFTGTADYMMALADIEGYEHICMPGLDFGGVRRIQEIIGAAYWIGALEGKGAKVYRSNMSMVFRHLRYGFHTEEEHIKYERFPETDKSKRMDLGRK